MRPIIDEIVAAAQLFKNVILEGPPGTGKSHAIEGVASRWEAATGRALGGRGSGEWAVTFHPSTAYEDFIEGVRLGPSGELKREDGFLLRCVSRALAEPDKDFIVLLDELNRANVPRVLGDALLPLEASKRMTWDGARKAWVGGARTQLLGSGPRLAEGDDEVSGNGEGVLGIPDNLYVLATMNTTDRSVAGLDAALRRRFAFVRVDPLSGDELVQLVATEAGENEADGAQESARVLDQVNCDLIAPLLGADHCLGHSYLLIAPSPRSTGSPIEALGAVGKEITGAATDEGAPIRRAFWFEYSATGGSGNLCDLTMGSGVANPGSGMVQLFVPSIPASEPTGDLEYGLEIEWAGHVYSDPSKVRIRWMGDGANPASVWRLNLGGEAEDGVAPALSSFAREDFVDRVLVFLETGERKYSLRSLPKSDVATLRAQGASDVRKTRTHTRWYGEVDLGKAVQSSRCDPLRRIWQYTILPQLFSSVTSLGAEDILTANRCEAFARSQGLTDEQVVGAVGASRRLTKHLADLGLAIRADGVGLSRSLRVLERRPGQHSEPAEQHETRGIEAAPAITEPNDPVDADAQAGPLTDDEWSGGEAEDTSL